MEVISLAERKKCAAGAAPNEKFKECGGAPSRAHHEYIPGTGRALTGFI
jgi:hypothetical protein